MITLIRYSYSTTKEVVKEREDKKEWRKTHDPSYVPRRSIFAHDSSRIPLGEDDEPRQRRETYHAMRNDRRSVRQSMGRVLSMFRPRDSTLKVPDEVIFRESASRETVPAETLFQSRDLEKNRDSVASRNSVHSRTSVQTWDSGVSGLKIPAGVHLKDINEDDEEKMK